jgi:hypothetical protein
VRSFGVQLGVGLNPRVGGAQGVEAFQGAEEALLQLAELAPWWLGLVVVGGNEAFEMRLDVAREDRFEVVGGVVLVDVFDADHAEPPMSTATTWRKGSSAAVMLCSIQCL